ncbi:MAG: GntR family transcriptional regulator [Deltaproteobacteria bacterium]|jgi:DNA-binding GntR family transcriptional regulator|nr:GntR family transcriptional regulator [Deltaproteobacteria bacterium]
MNKEEAYEELRVQIVTNGVAPGEILNEKDLMAQLSIGRSPLREILFRLQEENLIKPLPRLGYMVTTVDIFEVRDLVELRRELEGYAGCLAAQRITPEQLEDLRNIFREAEAETTPARNVANISEYFDTRFHSLLYRAAGNQKLTKILQDLHIVMLRIWFHAGLGAIGFGHQAENLYTVLEALEQKDPQKARAAMEDHVDQYAAQVKEKFL